VREKIQCVVGKHEGKRTLGRAGSRWEIILKWTLKIWDGDLKWIDLAPGKYKRRAAVNTAMRLFVLQSVGFFIGCENISLQTLAMIHMVGGLFNFFVFFMCIDIRRSLRYASLLLLQY
jgi:hypothetical protein